MRKITLFVLLSLLGILLGRSQDLLITGVVDGPLPGGLPKAIELYATADIGDLAQYGIGSANNGGGSDGEEFTLSGSASAGTFLYIASESTEFSNFFGFAPDFTNGAANINGDDAIELFFNGNVIDVFGEIDTDGTGQAWEYLDGWAYRTDETGADGTIFNLANWTFSSPNALDGETSNATAATPFPIGTYSPAATIDPSQVLLISGVIDGPLPGGLPKAIELYATADIGDLAQYGIGSANNGGGTDDEEFTLSGSASAGTFLYVASESAEFSNFFGFAPDFTDGTANVNGDDAIELFFNGNVVDVFGEIDTDGTGQAWEYLDGWAYRNNGTGPDGTTFLLVNWAFSGPNALDGETSNATAATPFPIGTFGQNGDDTIPPIAVCQDISIVLDTTGSVTILATDVDGGSTDNVGIVAFEIDEDTFTTNDIGDNTVTLTVRDAAGNTASCTAVVTVNAASDAPDLIITEIMYDPNSPEDDWEWVEIYNTTNTPIDLSGYVLDDINGTAHPDANIATGVIAAQSSVILYNADDVSATDFSAAWGNVNLVAVTNWSAMALNNGGDTVGIWDSFASYDGDHTIHDNTINSVDYGAAGFPDPVGASIFLNNLNADNLLGANWEASTDGAVTPLFVAYTSNAVGGNTGTDIGSPGLQVAPVPVVVLNELRITSQVSDDFSNYVELFGPANTALDGLFIAVVSGEFEPGQVDFVFDLSGASTDANGFFLLANADIQNAIPQAQLEATDVTATFDFFGSPTTFFVFSGATIAQGDDLDTDNDGILDMDLGTIVDSVSLIDGDANADISYSTTIIGPSGNFTPAAIARTEDGTGAFVELPFNDIAGDTPGFTNVNEPVAIVDAKIHEVQGNGSAVAITTDVRVTAIVVGDYQNEGQLGGFFIQEEDADADGDDSTSEGIFVFCGSCPVEVSVGDLVEVVGLAEEFFDMSQIDVAASSVGAITVLESNQALPTPASVDLPAPASTEDTATFENIEGMLVRFADDLFVSEYFGLARFGQLVLTADARPRQFTDENEPDVAGFTAFQEDLATRRIILDDDDNIQNSNLGNPDEPYFWPRPGLSNTNVLRGGAKISRLTGIMHWSFAGQNGTEAWRIRPVEEAFDYTFSEENPRQNAPEDVGGSLKVASFNVLNYFTTLDERGADSTAELDRQRAKIAAAICAMDADIVGLIEIENNGMTAINDLLNGVNGINSICSGTYEAIDTGVIGTDQIVVAFIYKTDTVSPEGAFAVLDSSVDPRFNDGRNRPALAQTFTELATNERLTIAVNHLKSKGSPCDNEGDPDTGNGAGNCDQTRANAAAALVDWLATDPTDSGDDDFMIIGDLNAYRNEAPIDAIKLGADDVLDTSDDYIDLLDIALDADAYSFVFDGQLGYLDYALANTALFDQVTGVTAWHINADEVNVFDYNDGVEDAGERFFERKSNALPIFEPNAFRASDHDPILVGLNLAPVDTITPVITLLGDNPLRLVVGDVYNEPGATAFDDVDGDLTDTIIIGGDIVDTNIVTTYEVTYTVTDDAGNTTEVVRTVIVEEEALAVERLILVNARTNEDIAMLENGVVVELNSLASKRLTIRAETTDTVESVFFQLSGRQFARKVENLEPFTLFGDFNGTLIGRSFRPGAYTIKTTPFGKDGLQGEKGESLAINFRIDRAPAQGIETATIHPNPARRFTKVSFTDPVELKNIQLIDFFGRVVRTFSGDTTRDGDTYTLNLLGLRRGFYVVSITDVAGNRVRRKLIIR